MKLKLKPIHLVCVILVQLILIDVFLIACFYKKLNNTPFFKTNAKAAVSEGSRVKASAAGIRNIAKGKNAGGPDKNSMNGFNIMEDFIKRFSIDKPVIGDYKIAGKHKRQKNFIATAYDLSYESCGKYPSHPEYGITYSGKPAVRGRTVAVDLEVIPLGSRLYIEFPKEYSYLNGWYVAEDTGSKIKGNIVDVFFGKSEPHETKKFGRRWVSVEIMSPDGNIGQ